MSLSDLGPQAKAICGPGLLMGLPPTHAEELLPSGGNKRNYNGWKFRNPENEDFGGKKSYGMIISSK